MNIILSQIIQNLKQPFIDKSKELDQRAERHKKGFRYNSNTDYHISDRRFYFGVALWIFFMLVVALVYMYQIGVIQK